jgi:hypothetical protein
MSVLELKSELQAKIFALQSEKTLQKVLDMVNDAIEKEEDLWASVPNETMENISKIVENNKNRTDLMTHDEAKKRHAKWLSK